MRLRSASQHCLVPIASALPVVYSITRFGVHTNSCVSPIRTTLTSSALVGVWAALALPFAERFFPFVAAASAFLDRAASFLASASVLRRSFSAIFSRSRRAASALRSSFWRFFSSALAFSRSFFALIAASSRSRFCSSSVGVFVRENLPSPSYLYSVPLSSHRIRSPPLTFLTGMTTLPSSATGSSQFRPVP